MGAYVQIAALVIQSAFLAVAMSAAAIGMKRIIQRVLAARREEEMKKKARAEGARARAAARQRQRKE